MTLAFAPEPKEVTLGVPLYDVLESWTKALFAGVACPVPLPE